MSVPRSRDAVLYLHVSHLVPVDSLRPEQGHFPQLLLVQEGFL